MKTLVERSGLADQMGYRLRLATAAVWSDLVATLATVGLRPQGYATLVLIAADPGCKQQDVADALHVARPNIVALVDALVAEDLVARVANANDRRSYALTLTPAGAERLATARTAHAAHERRVADAIGGDDADVLRATLARLAAMGHAET